MANLIKEMVRKLRLIDELNIESGKSNSISKCDRSLNFEQYMFKGETNEHNAT